MILNIILVLIGISLVVIFSIILATVDATVKEKTGCTYQGFGCAFYDENIMGSSIMCDECPLWKNEATK
jgi:hypothetical protein